MKIPSSSSVIFATLAISASSTSLAAPTNGDTPNSESSLTASPSGNLIADRGVRPNNMQEAVDMARQVGNNLDSRGILNVLGLGDALCPIVSSVVLDCSKQKGGKQATGEKQSMFEAESSAPMSSEEAIQRLQTAMDIIKQQQASDPSYSSSPSSPDGSGSADGDNGDSWDVAVGASDDDSTSQDDSDSTAAAADFNPVSPFLPNPPPNTPDMSSSVVSSSTASLMSSATSSSSTSVEPTDTFARRHLPLRLPTPDLRASAVSSSTAASSSSTSAETHARRDLPTLPTPSNTLPVTAPVAAPTLPLAAPPLPVNPSISAAANTVTGVLPLQVGPAGAILGATTKLGDDALGVVGAARRRRAAPAPPVQAPVNPPPLAAAAPSMVISVIESKPSDVVAAPASVSAAPSTVESEAPGPVGGAAAGAANKGEGTAPAPVLFAPEIAGGVVQTGASTGGSTAGNGVGTVASNA